MTARDSVTHAPRQKMLLRANSLIKNMSLWVDQVRSFYSASSPVLLTVFEQYRPRALDDLHYHNGLSARLKSLVSLFSTTGDAYLNHFAHVLRRQLLVIFRICYSMVLRVQGRRRVSHALSDNCLGRALRRSMFLAFFYAIGVADC